VFASKEFLKKLIPGEAVIKEVLHQIHYLKSRLDKHVGLKRYIQEFDLHSGVIYDALLNGKYEEMVKEFFNYCTVDKIVTQLKKNLLERGGYAALAQFFDRAPP